MRGIIAALLVALVAVVAEDCPPNWPPEQLLPHSDCHKFYQCVHGKSVEMVCPGDLYFNDNTWQCDWQANVDCGDRTPPGEETTTTPSTTTAAPTTTDAPTTTTAPITTTAPSTTAAPSGKECPPNWPPEQLLSHSDCHKYYQCVHGMRVEMVCPDDLYFNDNTWQCDWQWNVDCADRNPPENTTTTPSTTTAAPTTTAVPNPTTTPSTTAASSDKECPPNWPPEQLLPHSDCHKYYQCVHGMRVEMVCPDDLYFNDNTWQCDWQWNVDCADRNPPENTTTTPSTTTAAPTTTAVPNPTTTPSTTAAPSGKECPPNWPPEQLLPHSDCHKYYQCVHGMRVEMVCPDDLYFNDNTWQCDWQWNVDCADRNPPTTTIPSTTAAPTTTPALTTPSSGFLENGCPVNPHIHWLLPVPGDCNGFYYCVWGQLVRRACPPTLHFNTRIQVCDWPANAGCAWS